MPTFDECVKMAKAADVVVACQMDSGITNTAAAFSIIASIAIALTAIFAWMQVKSILNTNRLAKTLELIIHLQTNAKYTENRDKFIAMRDSKDGLKPHATEKTPDATVIRSILNQYELIAIGIENGILDEPMYKSYYRGTCIKDYNQASAFIQEERKENPKYWVKFQALAEKFSKSP